MKDADLFEEAGYALEEPVDSDEWGGLFRARYRPHGREVLLRAFPPALAREPGAWDLMQAEIQAWARLQHPGVVQPLDWGDVGGRCYVSTELPPGETLATLLSTDGGVERADELLAGLIDSVEAARQWGVLHLGLGLTNIWVTEGRAVSVTEFGFRYVAREFPALGVAPGCFASPEQLAGERPSAATDGYAGGRLQGARSRGGGRRTSTRWASSRSRSSWGSTRRGRRRPALRSTAGWGAGARPSGAAWSASRWRDTGWRGSFPGRSGWKQADGFTTSTGTAPCAG